MFHHILRFPQPYEAYCTTCNEQLRLWPAKGHPFYCDMCHIRVPASKKSGLKRSTGHNRLNCFLCDYDVCVNCAMDGKVPKRFTRTQGVHNRWQTTVEEVDEIESQPAMSSSWQLVNGQWQKVGVYQPPPQPTPSYNPDQLLPPDSRDLPPAYPADQYSSATPLINDSSLPYAIQPPSAPSAPPFINRYWDGTNFPGKC